MTALLFWAAFVCGLWCIGAALRRAARRTGLDEVLAPSLEDRS